MNAGIKAKVIHLPVLVAIGMIANLTAAPDPRLEPAAGIHAKKSTEILKNCAVKKGMMIESYKRSVISDQEKLTAEPQSEHYSVTIRQGSKSKSVSRSAPGRKKDLSQNRAAGKEMAALVRISDDLQQGIINPVPPDGLTMKQSSRHVEFIKKLNATQEAAKEAREKLDKQYLGTLGKLMSAPDTDAALVARIEEQKKRVLSGAPAPITDLKAQIHESRWQRINNPTEFIFIGYSGPSLQSYSVTEENELVLTIRKKDDPTVTTQTWKLSEDGTTLLKDGSPDLRLVHPDPMDFLRF